MRILSKIAFSFFICPILAAAQGPPPAQPDPPVQSIQEPPGASVVSDPSASSATPDPIFPVSTETHPLILLKPMNKIPRYTAYGPQLKVSMGYSVTDLGMPSAGRVAMNGANATISADSGKRYGAELDLGFSSALNVFNSGHSMHMLSYLAGPQFYTSRGNSVTTYVHLLAGGARVAGPLPVATGGWVAGHVNYPAWGAGGGVECYLSRAFALRVAVDYLHTHFYNSSVFVRGQNDISVVNSLVYYPGMLSPRKHH